MKANGIIFFHLIIWLLLAVGCESTKTNERATSRGISSEGTSMMLGSGYDSSENKFLPGHSCIKIPEDRVNKDTGDIIKAIIKVPPRFGQLTARRNVSASELVEDTLWGLGIQLDSGKTDFAKVAAAVGELAKLSSNHFTSNFVYSLKISGGKEMIDSQVKVKLDIPSDLMGDDPEKIKERRKLCGDRFLVSKQLGASLEAVLTFEFENEASKKFFEAQDSLFGEAEGVRSIIKSAMQFENVKIGLNITQLGGDLSQFNQEFPNGGNFTNCERNPDVCISAMDSFFNFTANFSNQFKKEKGVYIGPYAEGNYIFHTYKTVDRRFGYLGLDREARQMLDDYRELIARKFVDEYALFLQSESLLNRSPSVNSSLIPEIKYAQGVLSKRMEAITHVIRSCYGLDVDPEKKEDYDLTVYTNCESMVRKLKAFLYDDGVMNNDITCRLNDPGLPSGEDPLAEVQAKNWYYPMIENYGNLVKRHCYKIAKADIKFDPFSLKIPSITIKEWLQKYDKWLELLVKSRMAKKEASSRQGFFEWSETLLNQEELFSLFQLLRKGFNDKGGNKIDLKYEDFNVYDEIANPAFDETGETWKGPNWVIPSSTISNIENRGCKSFKFDKGTEIKEIENLYPFTSLSSLEAIDLSQNEVRDLTPLRYLSKLSTLFLDGNPINRLSVMGRTREHIKVLSLKNLPNLKEDGNLKSFIDDYHRVKLQDELAAFKNLEKIDLGGNSVWPVQEIANTPGGFPKLREIYLVNLTSKTGAERRKWNDNIKALLKSIIDQRDIKFPKLEKINISIVGVPYTYFAPEEIIQSLDDLKIGQSFSNPTNLDFNLLEPCTEN